MTRVSARHLFIGAIAAITMIAGGVMPVAAQQERGNPIPVEMLDLAFQECRSTCLTQTDSRTCDFLCDCSTRQELPKRMEFDRYLTFRQQMVDGEIDPAIQTILDQVAKVCFDRFKASGGQAGPAEEPAAAEQ